MTYRTMAGLICAIDFLVLIALVNQDPFQPLVWVILSNAAVLGYLLTKDS